MEKSLISPLSFVERMLERVKSTEHEPPWRKLEQMLKNNTLSDVQRKRLRKFIDKSKIKCSKPQAMPQEPTVEGIEPNNNSIPLHSDQVAKETNDQVDFTAVPSIIQIPKDKHLESLRKPGPKRFRTDSVKSFDSAVLEIIEKSLKQPSASPLTAEYDIPVPPSEPISTKAKDNKKSANPPLKLKLGTMFKRHQERIRKQREKRLKRDKVNSILKQSSAVQSPSSLRIGEVYSLHVLDLPQSTPHGLRRRESISKPQQKEDDEEYFKRFNLKRCSVNLTRCDADVKSTRELDDEAGLLMPDATLESDILVKEEIFSDSQEDSNEDHEPINRKVSRISYTIIDNELTMACLLCSFEHHNTVEFRKHLRSNHKRYRWYGNCNACGISNYYRATNNNAEFNHMLKEHIKKERVKIRKAGEPRRIVPAKNDGPRPMVSIPRELLPPEVQKMLPPVASLPPQAVQNLTPIIANTTKRRLQPWLEATPLEEHKSEDVCCKMLNLNCLSALFKCMGVNCSFFTNDMGVFEKHLSLHQLHQTKGDASYLNCSYCNFKAKFDIELSMHVNHSHGAAKYSCAFCFYRSYGPQVETHQFIYHFEKKPAMIKCIVANKKNLKDVVKQITLNASTNLSPISCLVCESKHYSFNVYTKHLLTMHHFNSTKCNNCSETVTMKTIIDHFKTCFKFGNYQCCYCPFGTDSLQQYKVHLVKSHPIDLPLYFDRFNEPDYQNPQGLLSIKRIPFVIDNQPCQVHMSPRPDAMRNEENVEFIV